jgi:ubiquinone/menaquinone biosynthesis C-methylase UbiE
MPESTRSVAREIIDHYHVYDESERLTGDIGPLELARTRELMLRYLPPRPAVILDVGGATGVYAFWLAGLGYRVHLIDIVPRHIERAQEASQVPETPQLASMAVGDARQLGFEDESADAVILHGPLYHLTEREERLRAIEEARRVLLPGGRLLAFAITRYAGLIYGLLQGYVFDADYYGMIEAEVRTGIRANPPKRISTFPRAYFHHPDELAAEMQEGGLEHETTLGVLGPAWMVPDLETSWGDQSRRAVILAIARLTEREPVLGPRLMALGRKPAE